MERIRVDGAMPETGSGAVLCLIDFSKESTQVLQASVKIAAASRAPLTVIYPYRLNQPRNVSDITQWKRNIDSDARNNFNRMIGPLLKEYDVTWEFKTEIGFLNDRVNAYGEKNKIGMIVLGKQMMLANREAASAMFTQIECPLLIIPPTKS